MFRIVCRFTEWRWVRSVGHPNPAPGGFQMIRDLICDKPPRDFLLNSLFPENSHRFTLMMQGREVLELDVTNRMSSASVSVTHHRMNRICWAMWQYQGWKTCMSSFQYIESIVMWRGASLSSNCHEEVGRREAKLKDRKRKEAKEPQIEGKAEQC